MCHTYNRPYIHKHVSFLSFHVVTFPSQPAYIMKGPINFQVIQSVNSVSLR